MKIRTIAVVLLPLLCGCGVKAPPPMPPPTSVPTVSTPVPAAAKIEKLAANHLPNAVRVHEKVISGGLPAGDAALAELKELGVKTVISVDGAKPDVVLAEKYGLRYVHLPHGYDGVPEQRAKELAKAVRDLPGPVYIHCHHGKHRSPAAAAVACVGAGFISPEDAATVLQAAGTSEAYRGLFQSAEGAKALDKALLDELQAEFPATARLPALAEAMVEIEHVHDRLQAIEKAGWKTPANQPDVVPTHEALLLREHFTEMLRTQELLEKPAKFQALTKEAEALCQALEDELKQPTTAAAAGKLFAAVSNNCKTCHAAFRDVPLNEKK